MTRGEHKRSSCDRSTSSSVGQLLSRNWSSDLCIYFPVFLKKPSQLAKFITQERSHKNPIYQLPQKIQIRQHPGNNEEAAEGTQVPGCLVSMVPTPHCVAPAPRPLLMPPAGNCDPYRRDRVPCHSDRKYYRISEERKHFGEHSKVEKKKIQTLKPGRSQFKYLPPCLLPAFCLRNVLSLQLCLLIIK